MALLLEAFSVYVKLESVDSKFLGGRQAFAETVKNDMFVYDYYIFSCGFLTYYDAMEYYNELLAYGLTTDDIAIASQIEEILTDSPWLKYSKMGFDTGKQMANISICHHIDEGEVKRFSTPSVWVYEGSISENCTALKSDAKHLIKRDEKTGEVSTDKPFIKEYHYPDEFA